MNRNIENYYDGVRVVLDNSLFEKCTFKDCTLVYTGSGPVGLLNNKFINPRWQFEGQAANTIAFLKGLHDGMPKVGPELVDRIIRGQS
jgi:hypothetical protein